MMPWSLPEGRERKRMGVHDSGVSLARCSEVGKHIRSEEPLGRCHRFERTKPAQDLVTIVTGHPRRSNLPGCLAAIEDRRTTDVRTGVRQVNRSLGIIGKAREELRAAADHLVPLRRALTLRARRACLGGAPWTERNRRGVEPVQRPKALVKELASQ